MSSQSTLSTPEININFEKHGQQYEAMDSLSNHIDFPDASVNTIDGVQSGLMRIAGGSLDHQIQPLAWYYALKEKMN